jgi:transcriptional regulator
MPPPQPDLLRGTLDAMILRTLDRAENHGYGIARAIEAAAGGVLSIEEGSLYPALYRLEKNGDLSADWRITELNRRAKYYRLTAQGKRRLKEEVSMWNRVSEAVSLVLAGKPA